MISDFQLEEVYAVITGFLVNYSFQLLGALIIVIIGAWLASKVAKVIENLMINRNIDVTLSRFTGGIIKVLILTFIIIIALGKLGVSITPLIAAIGALGIGAGLAIQGMLANFAAGFTIIITRPFVIGNTIKVQGVTGLVTEVHLGFTLLIDEDGVRIQIPNRHIVGEIIHNSSENLLVELLIGVSYKSDTNHVIATIEQSLESIEAIDRELEVQIGIDNFGDSSINFGVRFWAPTEKHYPTKYLANQQVLKALRDADIQIPFPQREVQLLNPK